MRFRAFSIAMWFWLALMATQPGLAQRENLSGERIVFCMIQLEHADAEQLAAVLEPFLSPAGSIAAYRPTNTLMIRDRESVVEQLSTAVKGKSCVAESNLE
ncbi:MAG: secretin N-terminal domain-containing protein [Desulfobacterales bacterium]